MVVAFRAQSGCDVSVVLIASNTRTREIPQAFSMLNTSSAANYERQLAVLQANCYTRAPAHLLHSPRKIRQTLSRTLHFSRIHAVIGLSNRCHQPLHPCAAAPKHCTAISAEPAWPRTR